jgi:hypothetical protein
VFGRKLCWRKEESGRISSRINQNHSGFSIVSSTKTWIWKVIGWIHESGVCGGRFKIPFAINHVEPLDLIRRFEGTLGMNLEKADFYSFSQSW